MFYIFFYYDPQAPIRQHSFFFDQLIIVLDSKMKDIISIYQLPGTKVEHRYLTYYIKHRFLLTPRQQYVVDTNLKKFYIQTTQIIATGLACHTLWQDSIAEDNTHESSMKPQEMKPASCYELGSCLPAAQIYKSKSCLLGYLRGKISQRSYSDINSMNHNNDQPGTIFPLMQP